MRAGSETGCDRRSSSGFRSAPLFLLTDDSPEDAADRLSLFRETIIPTVEGALAQPPTRRDLVGASMGGVNALILAHRQPDLFHRVAALCPPIAALSPYAGIGEVRAAVERSSTTWPRAAMLIVMGRHLFGDEDAWSRHDPIGLATSVLDPPALYLSCGARDSWGCMDGSRALVYTYRARELPIHWVPRPGGHCDVESESLAMFLSSER